MIYRHKITYRQTVNHGVQCGIHPGQTTNPKRRETMADCGSYKGVRFVRHRVSDILCVDFHARWYFPYIDGKPEGSHFRTLRELYDWINQEFPDHPVDVVDD